MSEVMDYTKDIVYLGRQHLVLAGTSGAIAIVFGLLLGVWLSRPAQRRLAEPAMQVLNVGTTVPTLAMLAISMTFFGVGSAAAIFSLCISTLLPIVRNTFVGLRSVSANLQEAAIGMGMTPFQVLLRVELPNAMYVIFAGIRTALIINIGTVPLAFLIGAGGLGELIFMGIDLDIMPMLLAGAIPTALLAILVDVIVGIAAYCLISKGVQPLRT